MKEGRFRSEKCICRSDSRETCVQTHFEHCPLFTPPNTTETNFSLPPYPLEGLPAFHKSVSTADEIASNVGFGNFVPVPPLLLKIKGGHALGAVFSGIVEDAIRFDMDLGLCLKTISLTRTESFLVRCAHRRVMSFIRFNMTPISGRRFLVTDMCEKTLRLASPEERNAQNLADEIYRFAVSEFRFEFEFECE